MVLIESQVDLHRSPQTPNPKMVEVVGEWTWPGYSRVFYEGNADA